MMGEGVEQDIDEAVKWYKKAAEKGDHIAQIILETLSPPLPEMEGLKSPPPSLKMEDSEDLILHQILILIRE